MSMRSDVLILALASMPTSSAFPAMAAELPAGRLVNRTLLTVGAEVYTAWDASVLACAR